MYPADHDQQLTRGCLIGRIRRAGIQLRYKSLDYRKLKTSVGQIPRYDHANGA